MNSSTQRTVQKLLMQNKWRESLLSRRSIVSQQFEAKEAWEARRTAPVFQKIKMGEYFVLLDKKFANEYRGSAVDVDIFANNVQSDSQAEHMEELLHKLRRTPHTIHTLESTHHAAVRGMLEHGEVTNLVKMLDDRMNYGLFLDEYSAVLTLDKLLELGDTKAAARCASQLMLQEDSYPLPSALGNLSCWRYFKSGRVDPWYYPDEVVVDDNPDEVIRVRVKVVPNNYKDDHFDLRDPDKILGKTFVFFNRGRSDVVGRSLLVLGNYLDGDLAEVCRLLGEGEVAESVLTHLRESDNPDLRSALDSARSCEADLEVELLNTCHQLDRSQGEGLVKDQTNLYARWNKERDEELERQYALMQRAARVEAISQTKMDLLKTEEKLFFFQNQDRYEMEKEEKVKAWVRTLPRTNWNMKWFQQNQYYKKKSSGDGERKVARWEKREAKKGPPK